MNPILEVALRSALMVPLGTFFLIAYVVGSMATEEQKEEYAKRQKERAEEEYAKFQKKREEKRKI